MPRGRRYRLSPRLSTEVERGRSRVVCAVQSLPYNTVVSSLSKIYSSTRTLKTTPRMPAGAAARAPRYLQDTPYSVAPGCPPCVSRDARRQHSRFQTRHTRAVAVELKIKGEGRGRIPLPTLQNPTATRACV